MKHREGTFSWVDLATNAPEAAKAFYGALFGWTFAPGAGYAIAELDGRAAAAIMPLLPAQKAMGAPPHWTCHFTVNDVDAVAKRAASAGATLLAAPSDVGDAGRMVPVDDPTGAGVVLWEPKNHGGAAVTDVPGAIAWCELWTRDVAIAREVWSAIFGWTSEETPGANGPYTIFRAGDVRACGMMPMPKSLPPSVPSFWLPYFRVADCDAAIAKATSLGGRALAPATEAKGVGRFATLADPERAVFGIVEGQR